MNSVFKRSEQLEDQIHSIRLRIPEWKVLFAIDGVMNPEAMADFLGIPEKDVLATLEKFKDMELIENVDEQGEETIDEFFSEKGEIGFEAPEPELEERELESEDLGSMEETSEEESAEVEPEVLDEELKTAEDEATLTFEDEASDESVEPEQKEEAGLEEQEFDDFIGGLLNEEETKDQPDLEVTEESPLETVIPPEDEEVGDEKEDADLGLGDFFKEDDSEALPAVDEVEIAEEERETEVFDEEKIEEKVEPEAAEMEELPGGKKTILVVDDSVVIRKMVEIALENEQYNIKSVANGKDALKYLDDNDPDIIILDIMLPDVNGLDVLKAVKASKQVPVVMLSAKDTPRETSRAKELGADDFIPKPFKDEELVSKIKELVGN